MRELWPNQDIRPGFRNMHNYRVRDKITMATSTVIEARLSWLLARGLRTRGSACHFRGLVLGFRKPRDEFAGILERDELTAAGQRDRIVELPLPSVIRH
jgi:hypothetical protein